MPASVAKTLTRTLRGDAFRWPAGSYLTDGRRLLRVVAPPVLLGRDGVAALEDCATLAVSVHTPPELRRMRLAPVETMGGTR
jgi:hypothetical protein